MYSIVGLWVCCIIVTKSNTRSLSCRTLFSYLRPANELFSGILPFSLFHPSFVVSFLFSVTSHGNFSTDRYTYLSRAKITPGGAFGTDRTNS